MISNNGRESMKQNARSIFYHRTTAENARSIIESGFRNSARYFLNNRTWTGVWLSSRPLDTGDDALLMVRLALPEQQLARWEWTAEGRSYREWLIPAQLINGVMTVALVNQLDLLPVAA
jgi:hypothetical protein